MSPRVLWPVVALGIVLLFNVVFTPGFARIEVRDGRMYGTLIDIADRAAPLMLVSLGMTLVIATRGVDLSVGAVMAIAGAVVAGLLARLEYSVLSAINLEVFGHSSTPLLAMLIALMICLFIGLGNGVLVALGGVQPIVATLVLMVAGRGIAQLLTAGQIITFNNPMMNWIGNGALIGLPVTISVAVVALAAIYLLTRKTALGLFLEATGDNPVASRHAGVPIAQVTLLAYGVCGLMAGIAGVMAAADIRAADANNAGVYIELDAILAVVIGGTALTGGRFYLMGSIIGALLIQSITTTILSRGVSVENTLVVKAAFVLAICLLQSGRARQIIWRRRK